MWGGRHRGKLRVREREEGMEEENMKTIGMTYHKL